MVVILKEIVISLTKCSSAPVYGTLHISHFVFEAVLTEFFADTVNPHMGCVTLH